MRPHANHRTKTDTSVSRPRTAGKFIEIGTERFLIKGVAYGTFAPGDNGQFPPIDRVRADFASMVRSGFNTVRTYTVPSRDVLDEAARLGLRVMIGLPWSQHVAFLDDARLTREIRREITAHVATLGSHPAALMFAVGNEIPPSVVRWHGHQRVTRFLEDLYADAKSASPCSLLTYVNYPPTDYLDLECFDVCAFNVYLHREADLRAYLARLQQLAGARPLLLAEAGADSIRVGLDGQAAITAMHVSAAFDEGLCGAVAFSWTDEWWRGGHLIEDWAFGLVDAERRPKPALAAVGAAFDAAPFSEERRQQWPRVSVVVCAYNAADTLDDCLISLGQLDYPDFEVVVVNDGSRDATGEVAKRYPVRVIDVPNGGLSAARNLGLAAATGEIVAYTDADVRVDRDWLTYLVQPFLTSDVVGSGGPNVVPPDDPFVAQCVARAPGGPTQVLLDDRIAEHVPGCNMAFRRDALLAIDGFNPVYLRAGDDVDVCWRLQARKQRIGFAPSALVWHHHRASVKAYWRQQVGYGEGEAWLEAHHPEKFVHGNMLWHGRIYSPLPFIRSLSKFRVNSGTWGTAAFPSVYSTSAHPAELLPHSAMWQALSTVALLAGSAALTGGFIGLAVALLILGALGWATTIARCLMFGWRSDLHGVSTVHGRVSLLRHRLMIAWLHFLQPLARVTGRVRGSLSPPPVVEPARATRLTWKSPAPQRSDAYTSARLLVGGTPEEHFWSETWTSLDALLTEVTGLLRAARPARFVDVDDGFRAGRDVSLGIGRWGWLDVRALLEEHGGSRCLLRVGLRLRPAARGIVLLVGLLVALAVTPESLIARWPWLSIAAAIGLAMALVRAAWQTAGAVALSRHAVRRAALTTGLTPIPMRNATRPRWQFRPGVSMLAQRVHGLVLVLLAAGAVEAAGSLLRDASSLRSAMAIAAGSETDSVETAVRASTPIITGDVAVAPDGDLLVADSRRGVIHRLDMTALNEPMRVSAVVSETDDRQMLSSDWRIHSPAAISIGRDGDLYVADAEGNRVSRIDRRSGRIVVVAGSGASGFDGDLKPAITASLNAPSGVAVAANGDVYIADSGNHRVRVVSATTGLIRTVAGTGQTAAAGADDDALGDGGLAEQAQLNTPSDVAVAPNGDIYIADLGHHRVRAIDAASGVISTVAGNGQARSAGDGGPARAASLAGPMGLALWWSKRQVTVYVAEYLDGSVRAITPGGGITTVGAPRRFKAPSRLAYRSGGWLYVVDERAVTVVNVSRGRTIQMAAALTRAPRHEIAGLPSRTLQ